eukprot:jgi/Botrbrau1/13308/Bobra.0315s0006.1
MNSHVIVFAKLPLPGLAKTRLGAVMGHDKASTFYISCCESALSQCLRAGFGRCILAFDPFYAKDQMRAWTWGLGLDGWVELVPQVCTKDLGLRMMTCLADCLSTAPAKAVLVGTDIPDLTATILQKALELLEKYEMVLGPSMDGGFYLIGLTKAHPFLFQGVPWSTPSTRDMTRRRAVELGISVAPDSALPALQDIDCLQDLESWRAAAEREGREHPVLACCQTIL